jgi:hypothetical protein
MGLVTHTRRDGQHHHFEYLIAAEVFVFVFVAFGFFGEGSSSII